MAKQVEHFPDWLDFYRKYGGDFMVPHATDAHYDKYIYQESVPIIFVPGIMGTRLSNSSGNLAWNPDSLGAMTFDYWIRGPKTESDNLTSGDLHVVDVLTEDENYASAIADQITFNYKDWDWLPQGDTTHELSDTPVTPQWARRLAKELIAQRWGEVASDFYTDFLFSLSSSSILETGEGKARNPGYRKIFQCPVYVNGYNWVGNAKDAGALLAEYVGTVIDREQRKRRTCSKVILISHSMGGLVVRSALKQFPGLARSQVLGVIHGAQPVNGAPVCYRRIRGGFESQAGSTGWVLGNNYKSILPILGRCIGGIELLPTENYKDNSGNFEWLVGTEAGKQVAARPAADVYSTVYGQDDPNDFFRLVLHQEGLSPGKELAIGTPGVPSDDFLKFKGLVNQAKQFHASLMQGQTLYQHPFSFHLYANGLSTFHRISWDFLRNQDKQVLTTYDGSVHEVDTVTGGGTDLNVNYHKENGGAYFRMAEPSPLSGDGTVPISSGAALLPGRGNHAIGKVEHADFYKHPETRRYTFAYIQQLLAKHKDDRIYGRS